ncbi:unnamed protein product [Miscanthus lutarioriparius]|uniref:NB-ARC domain-containing protein n=1 Tax=Miscanthus lutarioriparius TaxID=422564 RepID=A0A811RFE7_9POAL|nr:unnamed protein product [Miscanthus lutarioriparius]
MDDAEFLSLFKQYAFSGAEIKDQLLRMKLEHIAEETAKRLGQCPLAAKVLGSRLSRKKDITEWKAALKLNDLTEPFTALLWSYEKLDPHLQRCFLYCSLFPKGYSYKPDELVHLWVAEGLVDSCSLSRRAMEEVGRDYFTEMMLRNLKKMRVLYLSFYNSSKLPESVGELKHLRYLNLRRTLVSELPRSLCILHHLQLLHLNYMVKKLPDKLCNLSKLQHLGGYENRIPNVGKLTSLQHMHIFSVQKKQGYELRQLKDLNELGGSLTVKNLDNVTGKDEASESMLYKKNHLKKLSLVWNSENGMDADTLHLDILEGLRPSPQLSGLTIEGYRSGTYPSWLIEPSYFENLECFELNGCSLLERLPPDTELLRHCSMLNIKNVPNLKTLSCLPSGLTELSICGCPLLTFVTNNELEQHDLWQTKMKKGDLASKLASMWEVDSGSHIWNMLSEDCSSLKQIMTLMDDDISQHLQIIGSALEEHDIISVKENIIWAWLFCHEQRIRAIYGRTMELPLILPSGLRKLSLSSCTITDEALAICLGGLTSLESLHLEYNTALTTLPSESVFQHLKQVSLIDAPNLTANAKCISQFLRVQEVLTVSSSVLLNHMLRAEGFTVPPNLRLTHCKEPSVSFEEPTNLSSVVKRLEFWTCEMESLPRNLKFLSSLESLYVVDCSNIVSLPHLPSSLQSISIWACDALKENCREPNGESWPKISHIRLKDFR